MHIKSASNWAILLLSVTATSVMANTTTYTLTKNLGTLVAPYTPDFGGQGSDVLSYGAISVDGGLFRDTFILKSPKECSTITSISLSFKLKCDRSGDECTATPSQEGINFSSQNQPKDYVKSYFYYQPIGGSLLNATLSPIYIFNSSGPNQTLNNPINYLAEINNTRRVSFTISDDTSVHKAVLKYTCQNPLPKKGTTWLKHSSDTITGTVHVGCGPRKIQNKKDPYDYPCDPKAGDQLCTTALPILCKHEIYQSKPNSLNILNPQNEWAPQVVATTKSVAPANSGLNTLAAANKFCAAEFGERWTVASFFDGVSYAGWNFHSYGNTGTPPRFWVNVPGSPANCWNQ